MKKQTLYIIIAALLVLAAAIACLLLFHGRAQDTTPEIPAVTEAPTPSPTAVPTPVLTPTPELEPPEEPAITPPATSTDAASGSDVQLQEVEPSTVSDLTTDPPPVSDTDLEPVSSDSLQVSSATTGG